MIYLLFLITTVYITLISAFIIGFYNLNTFENKNIAPKNSFSIVIPFRNEASNLPILLNALSALNYPTHLFEILLVNDNSSDNFHELIETFKEKNPSLTISLLNSKRRSNSPKKEALSMAIKHANFEWIVTTDADCKVPLNWLIAFNQIIEEKHPLFISAPVKFSEDFSFLHHFQNLNFISLIGSTIGGFGIKKPFMCNGANLCYHKKTFIKVNGFNGNEAVASGDDIFLLEKIQKEFPEKVFFLKSHEANVETNSENNWTSFFNQQIRWASKSTSYTNGFSKLVAISVFLENLLLLILLIAAIISPIYWLYLGLIFIQKIIFDFILIHKTASLLKSKISLNYYIVISVIYPVFIIITAFLSAFKSYQWKGRTFNK